MRHAFDECRLVLFEAVLKGLTECADFFSTIERTARDEIPATGISLDLYPWHGAMTLSLRVSSDFPMGDHRYEIADWKYNDFPQAWETRRFQEAGQFIAGLYRQNGENSAQLTEKAHLIFLAGAEALLDRRVGEELQSLGIDAPIKGEYFASHYFEYIVLDVDETVKANYCEIVMANRVTNRLLG